MKHKIAIIKGDGIGPEITAAAEEVLRAVQQKFGHDFEFSYPLLGGAAIDKTGSPFPDQTKKDVLSADAVLLGAVGGPKWDSLKGSDRPEAGLLAIRSAMGLYANLRPARLFAELKAACPLSTDIADRGIDIMVVRELTGGIYFGERGTSQDKQGTFAFDTEKYHEYEIERIAKIAFATARGRRKKVTSIDKANVLDTSRLWRKVVTKVAEDYPDITLEHMLVDNCAMQLVKNPSQFDVMLCPNMFGDILSDEAAMITGSIGLLPSSSLGEGTLGLYEPIHGSAPDIAGTDTANPIATVLSVAMLLRSSLSMENEAMSVENAVAAILHEGYRTADIYADGTKKVTCSEMGRLISEKIR